MLLRSIAYCYRQLLYVMLSNVPFIVHLGNDNDIKVYNAMFLQAHLCQGAAAFFVSRRRGHNPSWLITPPHKHCDCSETCYYEN